MDQLACVTRRFVRVGLQEFCVSDGEGCAFDDVVGIAGEFQIAMIRSTAGLNESLVVDFGDS